MNTMDCLYATAWFLMEPLLVLSVLRLQGLHFLYYLSLTIFDSRTIGVIGVQFLCVTEFK
jgi:hypothetical protein